MMELNAEQIKKALEEMNTTGVSPTAIRKALTLINSQEQRIKELSTENKQWRNDWERNQSQWEEAYGKLDAENERLRDFVSSKCEECAGCTSWKCDCANIEAQAKADTVRKMHSMLCEGRVSNDTVVIVANQVAKEMLEGKPCT